MSVKLLTEHHLEFLSLKGGCTDSSKSTLVEMPHCWKSHVKAHFTLLTDHLKTPLDYYVNKLSKVQLLRAHERSGLIRARLLGFERCTAPVAVFLDSHCEAAEGIG